MLIDINTALDLLTKDHIVAIPTETVYGLAARYDSETAIKKIFHAKNRPLDHPLIVHIASPEYIDTLTGAYPSYVTKLIERFWPGPLTLVLEKNSNVSPLITAKQSTVALRIPNHPLCLELLSRLGKPVVAPSANPYCRISPTKSSHVLKYFCNQVSVLDGGPCELGIESTIILATHKKSIQLLRPGLITQEELEAISGVPCLSTDKSIKVSGNQKKHYSPNIPLIIFRNYSDIEAYANETLHRYLFIILSDINTGHHDTNRMKKNHRLYASRLYALWHEAEEKKYDAIFIEMPSNNNTWQGIIEKIDKASTSS